MIERYDMQYDDCNNDFIGKDIDGNYVLFEDYEDALLDAQYDLKELQKKYDKLIEKIGEIYREG